MKIVSVLISISLMSILSSSAQESGKTKLVFNGVSLSLGAISNQRYMGTLADFKKLTNDSEILEEDFSSYDKNSIFYNQETGFLGGVHTYFRVVNPNKEDQKVFSSMRIGISVSETQKLSRGYNKSEEYIVDTLVSNQTGKEYYVDSTVNKNVYMNYGQTQVFLSAAYLLGSNPDNRWSFYSGVGLMAGFSIESSTYISKSTSTSLDNSRYEDERNYYNDDFESDGEYYKNDNSFSLIASIPIGVDFRVGKKRKFWNNSHIAAEFQPSIYYYSIPELNTSTVTTASILGLTYKYMFR